MLLYSTVRWTVAPFVVIKTIELRKRWEKEWKLKRKRKKEKEWKERREKTTERGRVLCVCVYTGTNRESERENYTTADLAGDTCVTGGLTESSRRRGLWVDCRTESQLKQLCTYKLKYSRLTRQLCFPNPCGYAVWSSVVVVILINCQISFDFLVWLLRFLFGKSKHFYAFFVHFDFPFFFFTFFLWKIPFLLTLFGHWFSALSASKRKWECPWLFIQGGVPVFLFYFSFFTFNHRSVWISFQFIFRLSSFFNCFSPLIPLTTSSCGCNMLTL